MMARTRAQALPTLRILDRDPDVMFRVPGAPWQTTPVPTRVNRPALRDDTY